MELARKGGKTVNSKSACSNERKVHHSRVSRKRRRITITVLLCLGFALGLLIFSHDNEPQYEGKRLSRWLSLYGEQIFSVHGDFEKREQAEHAIRSIGTNSLPFLLKWIRYDATASLPRRWLYSLIRRLPPNLRYRSFWADSGAERASLAILGFEILGPTAKPAIPELAHLASTSKDEVIRDRVIRALGDMGPTGVEGLLTVITNKNGLSRFNAVTALCAVGTNATTATPALIECLHDLDPNVAGAAAGVIGELELQPDLTIPAITNAIRDSPAVVRQFQVMALKHFGGKARSAVPALVDALADDDERVRGAAALTLNEIAPEVLTNALASP